VTGGRACIIVNPTSGLGGATRLSRVVDMALRQGGLLPQTVITGGPGEAEERARAFAAAGGSTVVAVGGDGTLSEVANGIAGTATALVPVPTGTANMLAKEFGFGSDPLDAARAVLDGPERAVDAGRCGNRVFLCLGGVGFDAEVARRYGLARRGTAGYAHYVRPLVTAFLQYHPPGLAVTVDGAALDGPVGWVLVSNTRVYGGPLRFTRQADPADGLFELAAVRSTGPLSVAKHLLLALSGRFHESCETLHRPARKVTVAPVEGSAPLQLDGDFAGSVTPDAPAVFEILPSALRLRMPV